MTTYFTQLTRQSQYQGVLFKDITNIIGWVGFIVVNDLECICPRSPSGLTYDEDSLTSDSVTLTWRDPLENHPDSYILKYKSAFGASQDEYIIEIADGLTTEITIDTDLTYGLMRFSLETRSSNPNCPVVPVTTTVPVPSPCPDAPKPVDIYAFPACKDS